MTELDTCRSHPTILAQSSSEDVLPEARARPKSGRHRAATAREASVDQRCYRSSGTEVVTARSAVARVARERHRWQNGSMDGEWLAEELPVDAHHWREFDLRFSWTHEALLGLERALDAVHTNDVDGLDLLEHTETIVGVAYVTLQAYITSAIGDLKAAFGNCPEARCLRAKHCPVIGDRAMSAVEII